MIGLSFNEINYVDEDFINKVPISTLKIDTYNTQPQVKEFIEQFKANRTAKLSHQQIKEYNLYQAKFSSNPRVLMVMIDNNNLNMNLTENYVFESY